MSSDSNTSSRNKDLNNISAVQNGSRKKLSEDLKTNSRRKFNYKHKHKHEKTNNHLFVGLHNSSSPYEHEVQQKKTGGARQLNSYQESPNDSSLSGNSFQDYGGVQVKELADRKRSFSSTKLSVKKKIFVYTAILSLTFVLAVLTIVSFTDIKNVLKNKAGLIAKNINSNQTSTTNNFQIRPTGGSQSKITVNNMADLSQVCKNNLSTLNSMPYKDGVGNKLAVFYNTKFMEDDYKHLELVEGSSSEELASEVSVVACMDAFEGDGAGARCDYVLNQKNISTQLYRTNYRIRIVNPSTGDVIDTVNLSTNSHACPPETTASDKVYELPSKDMLDSIIRRYGE